MTDWKPAMRVPDPAVRVLDERFRPYVLPLAKLEQLATVALGRGPGLVRRPAK